MAGVQYTWVNNPLPYWPQPSTSVDVTVASTVLLSPADNAQQAFDTFSIINLQPGKVYHWTSTIVKKPTILNGNNATVYLAGDGPIIQVQTGEFDPNVTNNISRRFPCIFRDVIFKGSTVPPPREELMSESFFYHGGIYVNGVRGVSVVNCMFENFNGTALWFDEDLQVNGGQWDNFNSVTSCRFKNCRHAISNGGRAEYGVAVGNLFQQCQVAFNVCGGNWVRSGNNIVNSRCGYLHTAVNWYMGGSGNQNPAHGTFVGNSLNHANDDTVSWPTVYRTSSNPATQIALAAVYFDDTNAYPPNFVSNTMYFCDMSIVRFARANNFKWSLTGNVFYSTTITVTNQMGTSMYLVGCTGNSVTRITGIASANVSPEIGTIVRTRELALSPPLKRKKKSRACESTEMERIQTTDAEMKDS